MFGQVDSSPGWYTITIRYHQTPIEQFSGISLDGGRCFAVAPARSGISFGKHYEWDTMYCYYIKNTLHFRLHWFYQLFEEDNEPYQYRNYMKLILVFNSETERESFEYYVVSNKETLKELAEKQETPMLPEIPNYKMSVFKEEYANALALQIMLQEFRRR